MATDEESILCLLHDESLEIKNRLDEIIDLLKNKKTKFYACDNGNVINLERIKTFYLNRCSIYFCVDDESSYSSEKKFETVELAQAEHERLKKEMCN